MSQRLLPDNIRLCRDCGCEIDIGKQGNRKKCDDCKKLAKKEYARKHYAAERIIKKLQRQKNRKCRRCRGKILVLISFGKIASQYCCDYCQWMTRGNRRMVDQNRKIMRLIR